MQPENKSSFADLLRNQAFRAIKAAEVEFNCSFPETAVIELHGLGYEGELMSIEETANLLYLPENKFHRVIDVSLVAIQNNHSIIFVRPSGPPPGIWLDTWNPIETGPFKVMTPERVEDR